MQPNTVTLAVDLLNNGTTVPRAYTRFEEFQNRAVYVGPSHTPAARDQVILYRSFPTKSGNFNGVQKTTVKVSEDVVVAGADLATSLSAPAIIEVSFSFPVGLSPEKQLELRQRVVAIVDLDEVMVPLNNQCMI